MLIDALREAALDLYLHYTAWSVPYLSTSKVQDILLHTIMSPCLTHIDGEMTVNQ